ncbi:uncharacterized protein UHOD_11529 [Ustilago sp. UG-2017b]|nr:uncharacterized protein UHOD_11529 [Ustilago sp. UG-2017b]
MLTNGQLSVVDDSSDSRTSAFVKAIPSIATLAQVWLVYVAIRARHTANLELNAALLAHLEQLLEFDHLYLWCAVADYHLAVCCQRFGTAAISEWVSYDPQVAGRVLFPYQKSSHNSSCQDPNLGSSSGQSPPMRPPPALANAQSQALPASSLRRADDSTLATCVLVAVALTSASTARVLTLCCPALLSPRPPTWWPRRWPDGEYFSSLRRIVTPASTAVKCVYPAVLDTLNVVHRACTAFECAAASIAVKRAFPGATLRQWRALPPSVQRRALPSNVRMGTATPALSSPRSGTPSTSNTRLTPPSSMLPLAALPKGLVDMPPDSAADLLLSLLTGPPPPPWPNTLCKLPIFDKANLLASVGSLQLRLWSRFLALYPDQAFADQLCGVCHGAKLDYEGPLCSAARLDISNLPLDDHNVFHLHQEITARLQEAASSRPSLPSTMTTWMPSWISSASTPGASLWKANLEDAFRHVIVAESDTCLMGIHFDGVYYQECALAFGARSSPFLFNLFAKFLHWLVTLALQSVTAHSPLSHSGVSHYLDDFFGASDLSWDRMRRSRSHMRRSAGIEDRGLYSRVHRDL